MILSIALFVALCVMSSIGEKTHFKPAKRQQKALPSIDPGELETLQTQAEALCEYALELEKKSDREKDALKKARYASQAATTYARANNVQKRIDKMSMV